MSDIDFEELDKAVNSLVGSNDEKKDAAAATSDKPEDIKPDKPSSDAQLPSRRKGRFMDMKHSSSDMQKEDGPPKLMKTSETNIKPEHDIEKPTLSEPKKDDSEEKQVDAKSDWPDPIETSKPKDEEPKEEEKFSTDMPDPLDHMENMDSKKDDMASEDESKKPDDDADKKEDETEPEDEKLDDTKEDDKKTSPFLDDAKVEKRPLGGFSSDSPVEPPKEGADADEKGDTPTPPIEPVELPPELDKNLVAIEAGETLEELSGGSSKKDKQEKEKEEEKKDKEEEKPKEESQKDKVSELLASAASGSIPDQYKRENRSHELHSSSHPLFNDEHYKSEPSGAPKKPKSTVAKIMQWVMLIVGLLLLGGSIGAAIFLFTTQS